MVVPLAILFPAKKLKNIVERHQIWDEGILLGFINNIYQAGSNIIHYPTPIHFNMPKTIELNRNENPYGPSPLALKALRQFRRSHAFMYLEDYYNSLLIPKISRHFGIEKNRIILYYGIEDFIRNLFSQLDPKKDCVLTNEKCFSYFEIFASFRKIKLHLFKLDQENHTFSFNIDDCLKKIKKYRPRVVIISNPNNPTGHRISFLDLERIIKNTPRDSFFLVDETYCGFYPNYEEKKFKQFLEKYPNLVFLRTFSKFYGLAGLRVGFGFCGKSFKKMMGYDDRFLGFSRVLEEVAVAALNSEVFYKKIAKKICQDRDWFINQVNLLKNFRAYDSSGNFTLVELSPQALRRFKRSRKNETVIIWRWVDKKSFRVSIGKTSHLKNFLSSLQEIDYKIKNRAPKIK